MKRPHFTRAQKTTIVYGILCVTLIIVVLQLWLLTATMEAFLGGDTTIPTVAALVSLGCFGLCVGLFRYLNRLR